MKFLSILLSVLCLSFLGASGAVSSTSSRGNVFEVEAKIFAGDRMIGQPQFTVVAGSEAAMGVSSADGYGLRLTVDEDATRSGRDPINVSARLYFAQRSEWVLVGAPIIQMEAGGTSRQSSSAPTVYGAGDYSLEITVRRTDRVASAAAGMG